MKKEGGGKSFEHKESKEPNILSINNLNVEGKRYEDFIERPEGYGQIYFFLSVRPGHRGLYCIYKKHLSEKSLFNPLGHNESKRKIHFASFCSRNLTQSLLLSGNSSL